MTNSINLLALCSLHSEYFVSNIKQIEQHHFLHTFHKFRLEKFSRNGKIHYSFIEIIKNELSNWHKNESNSMKLYTKSTFWPFFFMKKMWKNRNTKQKLKFWSNGESIRISVVTYPVEMRWSAQKRPQKMLIFYNGPLFDSFLFYFLLVFWRHCCCCFPQLFTHTSELKQNTRNRAE